MKQGTYKFINMDCLETNNIKKQYQKEIGDLTQALLDIQHILKCSPQTVWCDCVLDICREALAGTLHENCDGAPDGGHTKECKERAKTYALRSRFIEFLDDEMTGFQKNMYQTTLKYLRDEHGFNPAQMGRLIHAVLRKEIDLRWYQIEYKPGWDFNLIVRRICSGPHCDQ